MSMTNDHSPRPNYTLTDAARLVGVSRSTIRRRREAGKFPDSFKTNDGEWMIPLTNLLADGLRPSSSERVYEQEQSEQGSSASAPTTLTPLAQAARSQAQAEQAHLQERLRLAEKDLEVERAKSDGLAQTLAATQARANDLSLALRMIEQAKPPIAVAPAETPAAPPEPTPAPADKPAPKRWWQW